MRIALMMTGPPAPSVSAHFRPAARDCSDASSQTWAWDRLDKSRVISADIKSDLYASKDVVIAKNR